MRILRHSTSERSGDQFASIHALDLAADLVVSRRRGEVHERASKLDSTIVIMRSRCAARRSQEHLRALGPLEPEVGVVLPGEPDPAAELDALARRVHVGVARHRLRHARRPGLALAGVEPARGVMGRGSRQLDLEQQIGAAVLQRLERPDGPPELKAHAWCTRPSTRRDAARRRSSRARARRRSDPRVDPGPRGSRRRACRRRRRRGSRARASASDRAPGATRSGHPGASRSTE